MTKRNKVDIGMRCPSCQSLDIYVTDRRGVRRRRHCESCGFRFTSIEVIINEEDIVHGGLESTMERYKKRLGTEAMRDFLKGILEADRR